MAAGDTAALTDALADMAAVLAPAIAAADRLSHAVPATHAASAPADSAPAAGPGADTQQTRADLQALLRRRSLGARQAFESWLTTRPDLAGHAQVAPLRDALDRLDYRKAAECLEKLPEGEEK